MTYKVNLDIYEGPLDLLLYLVKRSDLDIRDVAVSRITGDYLAYVDLMKELRLDLAGEFLVMASTLMQMKARSLLPSPSSETDEGPDPRAEIVNRLLEYQRYKEAARTLEARLHRQKDVHYRGAPLLGEGDYVMNASLFDLLDAFRDVLKGLRPDVREIVYEEVPIEVKIRGILSFLAERTFATFREILQRETTRRGLIATFLAVLELIRLRQIVARQAEVFGEIRVYRVDAVDEQTIKEPAAEPEPAPAPAPAGPAESGEDHGTD